MRRLACFLVLYLAAGLNAADKLPHVTANDHHAAAGILSDGVLRLRLEIRRAQWYPEEEAGASIPILAFSEEGKTPEIPGPMIRVPEGTKIRVRIRNGTNSVAKVYGFHTRPGSIDYAIEIPPRQFRQLLFNAGAAGAYYYWATTSAKNFDKRTGEDSQLSGVIIVESPAARIPKPDHVFVLGHWFDETRELWVINGKMWPFTQRLEQKVGEPMHTLWINPTNEGHPMHLHGGYFTVLSEGDSGKDEIYQTQLRPVAATYVFESGKTMEIEWTPQHPGNWLFHCHIFFHTDFRLGLNPPHEHNMQMAESLRHMSGLAIGFTATEAKPESQPEAKSPVRKMDLYISERDQHYEAVEGLGDHFTGMGYSLREEEAPSNPGPPIFLIRDQPVEITVHNLLKEATSVHWHGIELQSYYDGVPGWGGDVDHQTHAIMPGNTFIAKFTPPRAGSFMYHTHLNDTVELSLGLSGPLIVTEPDHPFDPETDKIFFISRDGPDDEKAPFLLNGSTFPSAMTLKPHVTYRLRFLAMTTATGANLFLTKNRQPVQWIAKAKDGADLTPALATPREAKQFIEPGETYDFEWSPVPGEYRLEGRDDEAKVLFARDIRVQ